VPTRREFTWTDRAGRRHSSPLNKVERSQWAKERLERWRLLYQRTHNPRYAWEAYSLVSDFDLTAPRWVCEYLSSCAENLRWVSHPVPKKRDIARAIVSSLGFAPGGVAEQLRVSMDGDNFRENHGAYNPFARNAEKELELAQSVAVLTAMNPKRSKTSIVQEVARIERASAPSVWRALRAYPEITVATVTKRSR
jgi:hypothetical protein